MDHESDIQVNKKPQIFKVLNLLLLACFIVIILFYFLSAPLSDSSIVNRQGIMIHVSNGQSVSIIAKELEAKNVVRQALVFKFFVSVLGGSHKINRGDYFFDKSEKGTQRR